MFEYLDSIDSDSDFILESDTDNTNEDDNPHALTPAAHPVSDSEEDDMDDEDYREILSPEQPLPLLSNSKNNHRIHEDLQVNTVLSEIKKWNTKYLRKLEKHTNAPALNLLDSNKTTHKLK
jgi:hypothetical protein